MLDVKESQPRKDIHINRLNVVWLPEVVQRLGFIVEIAVESAQVGQ